MRTATVVVLIAVLAALGGVLFLAVGAGGGGQLTAKWVSDTPRENTFNHHAVGVGPNGSVVVAPVTGVPGIDEMTAQTCSLVRLGASDGEVSWRQSLPPEDCFSHAITQPAIADLDGDGSLEVAVGTTQAELVVFDAHEGDREFAIPMSSYGYGQPAVGNLTATPGAEVVVSDIQGTVLAVSSNGTELWRVTLGDITWASPVIADVDGDGAREVLVGTNDRTVLLNAAGDIEWSRPVSANTIAAGQADDDSALEVFTTTGRTIVAFDGATGAAEWRKTFEWTPRVGAVADADGDGDREVYASLTNQHIVALTASSGAREWETTVVDGLEEPMAEPVVGDVTGDGRPEIVAVANDGTVSVLEPSSGDELASYSREMAILTYATLGDIDGDGAREILVRYADGRVVALDYET